MGSNRGPLITAALVAGFIWGVIFAAYLLLYWVTPEQLVSRVSPYQLHFDPNGQFPSYRDAYAARAASRFVALGGASQPAALITIQEELGVKTGDITSSEAVLIVRSAQELARKENAAEPNPDAGRFTLQDQQNLAALADRLDATKNDPVPGAGTSVSGRNTFNRIIGGLFLLFLAAAIASLLWMLARSLNAMASPVRQSQAYAPIPSRNRPAPALDDDIDDGDVEATLEDDLDDDFVSPPTTKRSPASMSATTDTDLIQPARGTITNSEQLISTFSTQFEIGNDNYDEDFPITGANGELIGELGATAGERVGLEMPYKVVVLLIWLFDKLDFHSTTKVLMTDHAYNDSAIKDKLKSRGDLILARNGVLEIVTSTMRVEVEVSGLDFAPIGNEPHGYFENVNLQFRVYRRSQPGALPG